MVTVRSNKSGVPYGYIRVGSKIVPGPEAGQVRALFELYNRGVPVHALAMDFGRTGTTDRPGLRHLLEAAKCGLVSEVVVSDPSRLARSRIELEQLLLQFDALGVRVTFGSQVGR